MSQYVAENASRDRSTNLKIFKHFVLKFREVISDKSSSYLDLALAVKGYGYFAAVRMYVCMYAQYCNDVQYIMILISSLVIFSHAT